MTIQEAQHQLLVQLKTIYEDREAVVITDWTMEHVTGWKKIDRIMYKAVALSAAQLQHLENFAAALLQHKPVQYVLNEAWFYGMKLYVDENVLIPRPETEELVEWVLKEALNHPFPDQHTPYRILDIGTGSGCIPIALKKQAPLAKIYAADISEEALAVAQKNATLQQTPVEFLQIDILHPSHWQRLPITDIIVSNPPYIPQHNKPSMQANVLKYEPHLALFVSDEDPLVFYRSIAAMGLQRLSNGGSIFVEIHEDLGELTRRLFEQCGYGSVELRKDIMGKDRMIRAVKK